MAKVHQGLLLADLTQNQLLTPQGPPGSVHLAPGPVHQAKKEHSRSSALSWCQPQDKEALPFYLLSFGIPVASRNQSSPVSNL